MDEAVTVRLARTLTLSNIQATLSPDRHPPCYYFLLKAWLEISSTVLWIRLLSAIIGILTVYQLFLLGKQLLNTKAGLIAAFLLAISPYHIYYSQETRMYTLECFWFILATYWLYQALTSNKIKYWLGYIIALEGSLYTHYYTLFLIGTHGCVVLYYAYHGYGSRRFRRIRSPLTYRWCLAIFAVLLGFIPLISLFLIQMHSQAGTWVPAVQGLDLFKTVHWFIFGNYFNSGAFLIRQGNMYWLHLIKFFMLVGNGLVYVVFGYIIWKWIKAKMIAAARAPALPFLLWHLFGLMIFPWLISFFTQPDSYYYGQRYQLGALPFFLLLLGYGINLIPQRKIISTALAIIIIVTSVPLYSLYLHLQKLPWKDAVALLQKKQQKNDALLLCRNYTTEIFEFYALNQFKFIKLPERGSRLASNWQQKLPEEMAGYSRV
ncbi:MAG: glycosyltransferase family 39 protein [bacterium]|nr:glycosyltransferase family 39 protein [bacterium]